MNFVAFMNRFYVFNILHWTLFICPARLLIQNNDNQRQQLRLNNEINQLIKDIWRVGDPEKPSVPFGELFDDEDVQQHYEGLAATLKAAKKSELSESLYERSFYISQIQLFIIQQEGL